MPEPGHWLVTTAQRCVTDNGTHWMIDVGRSEMLCGNIERCIHCGHEVLRSTDESKERSAPLG